MALLYPELYLRIKLCVMVTQRSHPLAESETLDIFAQESETAVVESQLTPSTTSLQSTINIVIESALARESAGAIMACAPLLHPCQQPVATDRLLSKLYGTVSKISTNTGWLESSRVAFRHAAARFQRSKQSCPQQREKRQ